MTEPDREKGAVMVQEIREKIPCGDSITTQHLDSQGVVVRQDVHIVISPEAWAAACGSIGTFGQG